MKPLTLIPVSLFAGCLIGFALITAWSAQGWPVGVATFAVGAVFAIACVWLLAISERENRRREMEEARDHQKSRQSRRRIARGVGSLLGSTKAALEVEHQGHRYVYMPGADHAFRDGMIVRDAAVIRALNRKTRDQRQR